MQRDENTAPKRGIDYIGDPSAEKSTTAQGAMCPDVETSHDHRINYVLREVFRYHNPRPEQLAKYQAVRTAAKNNAEIIIQNTPRGKDQDAALLNIRLAMMLANAAIALDGLSL